MVGYSSGRRPPTATAANRETGNRPNEQGSSPGKMRCCRRTLHRGQVGLLGASHMDVRDVQVRGRPMEPVRTAVSQIRRDRVSRSGRNPPLILRHTSAHLVPIRNEVSDTTNASTNYLSSAPLACGRSFSAQQHDSRGTHARQCPSRRVPRRSVPSWNGMSSDSPSP
jgi:hypothetical protein